jgi:hypothetical protein
VDELWELRTRQISASQWAIIGMAIGAVIGGRRF